jgi:hypothetical protein
MLVDSWSDESLVIVTPSCHIVCDCVSSKEFRGIFWPRPVFESFFGTKLLDVDTVVVRNITGAIRPRLVGQSEPIGTIELYNDDTEGVEKRDVMADSDRAESKLFHDQLDQNFQVLCTSIYMLLCWCELQFGLCRSCASQLVSFM